MTGFNGKQIRNTAEIAVKTVTVNEDRSSTTPKFVAKQSNPANPDVSLQYNEATSKWQYTNDGTTFTDFGSGGSGSTVYDAGEVAMVSLEMPKQPTAGDTITVGADTYEFDGIGANINVPIAPDGSGYIGLAAGTRANLVTAVNNNGTENVLAMSPGGTAVVFLNADAPGGTQVVGAGPNLAFTESITDVDDVLRQTNMNESGCATNRPMHTGSFVCTAENTAGTFVITFPFTPTGVIWSVADINGTHVTTTARMYVAYGYLFFNPEPTGTPPSVGDIVSYTVFG